jgi:hypothetical protein
VRRARELRRGGIMRDGEVAISQSRRRASAGREQSQRNGPHLRRQNSASRSLAERRRRWHEPGRRRCLLTLVDSVRWRSG